MNKTILSTLLGAVTILSAGQALALTSTTTTQLRCLYKTSSINTNPESNYEWALASSTSTSLYKISGKWWQTKTASVKNMFFTNTSQATMKSLCANTLTRKGITQPLMMMAAADTWAGVNYTIWTNDSATQAAKINKVVVFGDSVSDTQNVYSATNWELPSPHSYFLGHFTNGKVWNEYLSDNLNVPNYNWAVGGAAADDCTVIPGVKSQVESYVEYMKSAVNYKPANSLFTMLVGANDLISYGRSVDEIMVAETAALNNLLSNGAKNILVLNVPNLSVAPKYSEQMGFKTAQERADLLSAIGQLNVRLAALVDTYKTSTTVKIRLYDTYKRVNDLLAAPATFGITNPTQSCLDINSDSSLNYTKTFPPRVNCTNADAFLFWDLLHPTTRAHKLIADEVITFVRANFPVQ